MENNRRSYIVDGERFRFNSVAFNKLFNKKRNELNLSVNEFEMELGNELAVTHYAIHNWRFGSNGPSDIETVQKLAETVNEKDFKIFLERIEEPMKKSEEQIEPIKTISFEDDEVDLRIMESILNRDFADSSDLPFEIVTNEIENLEENGKQSQNVILNFIKYVREYRDFQKIVNIMAVIVLIVWLLCPSSELVAKCMFTSCLAIAGLSVGLNQATKSNFFKFTNLFFSGAVAIFTFAFFFGSIKDILARF